MRTERPGHPFTDDAPPAPPPRADGPAAGTRSGHRRAATGPGPPARRGSLAGMKGVALSALGLVSWARGPGGSQGDKQQQNLGRRDYRRGAGITGEFERLQGVHQG